MEISFETFSTYKILRTEIGLILETESNEVNTFSSCSCQENKEPRINRVHGDLPELLNSICRSTTGKGIREEMSGFLGIDDMKENHSHKINNLKEEHEAELNDLRNEIFKLKEK